MATTTRPMRTQYHPFDIPVQEFKYIDDPFVDEFLRSVDRVTQAVVSGEDVSSDSLDRIVCMARLLGEHARRGEHHSHVTFTETFANVMAACVFNSEPGGVLLRLALDIAPLVSRWAYTSDPPPPCEDDVRMPVGWWKFVRKLQDPLNIREKSRRMPSKAITKACWDVLVAIVRDVPEARRALYRARTVDFALASGLNSEVRQSDEERFEFLYYLLVSMAEPEGDRDAGRAALDKAKSRFKTLLDSSDPSVDGSPAHKLAHLNELYFT